MFIREIHNINGKQLSYIRSNEWADEVIFFFHGFTGSREYFPEIETEKCILSFDRPGVGESSYIIGYKLNAIAPYEYELNVTNVLGSLGFQLLLSGTSEEILFRALPIIVFGEFGCREEKNNYQRAIIIASVLFSIAHIKWTIFPFTVF